MIVDSPGALADLIDRALNAAEVGLDTEFVWDRTFYPRLGLIQMSLPDGTCHLIDTVVIEDLTPLGRVLAAEGVIKVLHDAQQDLTILTRATGSFPRNIFDTQISAGLVGLTYSTSLARLVTDLLGLTMSKDATRSDWIRRPLSERQLSYARADVRYLMDLKERLIARAAARGRTGWVNEEMAMLDDPDRYRDSNADEIASRMNGSSALSNRHLSVLRELVDVRESAAKRLDRPRGHILPDKDLLRLSRKSPRHVDDLPDMGGIIGRQSKAFARELLSAIEKGLERAITRPKSMRASGRATDIHAARADFLYALVKSQCIANDIDVRTFGSRSDMNALARAGSSPDPADHRILQGWRKAFVGDALLAVLSGEANVQVDPQTGLPSLR